MDIQVSSNFERLLFELLHRDADACASAMAGFRADGRMIVPDGCWREMRALFSGSALDDPATEAEMRRLHGTTGYLADPHTAIGVAAARAYPVTGTPMIAMATAHPAKFPDAVRLATGVSPPLPPFLADLYERTERFRVVPNRLDAVQDAVRGAVLRNAA